MNGGRAAGRSRRVSRWAWLHLLWSVPLSVVVGYLFLLVAWMGSTNMGMCTATPTLGLSATTALLCLLAAGAVACPWAAVPWARRRVRIPVAVVLLVLGVLACWGALQTC